MEPKTILVIEDNPINMKLIRVLLHSDTYRVFEAGDAETGIQLAQVHQPRLILMDVQLPAMDGLKAIRLIRKDPVLKMIPIVVLTSHAMAGDEQKALEAGADDYISKPIDTRGLLKKIEWFLNNNHLPRSE